jgi:hypothetical protein
MRLKKVAESVASSKRAETNETTSEMSEVVLSSVS